MKSILVLVVLFSAVFTLSQGSTLKTKPTQLLRGCEKKTVESLINKIIDDTFSLKGDVYKAYQNLCTGIITCVVTSLRTVVSCVEDVVLDNVRVLEKEVETYISTVHTLGEKLVKEIEECV